MPCPRIKSRPWCSVPAVSRFSPLNWLELIAGQQGQTATRHIPSTLSGLLQSRLDQLGSAKRIAQVAAVTGDEVARSTFELLLDAVPGALNADLALLVDHGVLRERRTSNETIYNFTHALLSDAAYDTLPKNERRQLHRRAAAAISASAPDGALLRPEIVAHHWTSAADWDEAVRAWQIAGDLARARRGFVEAERAYENAVSALINLSPSPTRDARELMLQSLLADVVRITHGFSARKTIDITERARELADQNCDRDQQFLQMWGAWTAASSSGDHPTAAELADKFQRLAIADGRAVNLAYAHMIHMTSTYRLGDLIDAERTFRQGEKFFTFPAFEQRPGIIAQTYGNAARIAWILGDSDQAQQRIDHALSVARKYDNPYDMAYAQYMSAIHAVLTQDFHTAVEHASNAIRISEEYQFQQFLGNSRVALGRALAGLNRLDEGINHIRDALFGMSGTPVRVALTMYMTWLAETYLCIGDYDEALKATDSALQTNQHEMFFRPETLRVRGEIFLRLSDLDTAERSFLDAISLATRMGAECFRCRANVSLCELSSIRQSGNK